MNMAEAVLPLQGFTPQQVQAARLVAAAAQRRVVEVLEEQSGLDAQAFVEALGAALHYPVATMADLYRMQPAFDALPFAEAMARECLALRDEQARLVLAMGDPFDVALQAWAEQRIAAPFSWRLAHPADVAAYLAQHEETLSAMDSLLPAEGKAAAGGSGIEDLSFKTISEGTSPVVRLVHSTLYDALKAAASDIHLETGPAGLAIKYRIDGVLTTVGSMAGLELAEQVISRVKIMSELDIAERRVPQDGRFKVSVHGHEVDFRVSVMPSIFGEDAVLRILDKQTLSDQIKGLRLSYLGLDDACIAQLRRLSAEPYGMLLVTGPTGSGKTTTLYAAITEINHGQDKIITIEDPVEYQLPGVLQIPVNEKKGLTFARGLRSILRHDPDKIMVGEIRDPETAQIAVQSALTGHLVFTTVHANNVFDVLGRFLHMGIDPYNFVSCLNCVAAQRLVRKICVHCKRPVNYDARVLSESGLNAERYRDYVFYEGAGCRECNGQGYHGRTAIVELLDLDDDLREMILNKAAVSRLKEAARAAGTRFLRDAAVAKLLAGVTTIEEINRVTFVEQTFLP